MEKKAMETSARKTLDDIRRQAATMISSGYSLTTTAHVLGVQSDLLKKWVNPEELPGQSKKAIRKM
jgi:transposase-like protein